MPHLSPTTLTSDEQALILHVTQPNLRDHVIYSLALGTGLRLAEISTPTLPCSPTSPAVGSRNAGSSTRGQRGSAGRGSIGSTGSTRSGTRRSQTSTGRQGICSSPRDSRGMCRRSPPRSIPTPRTMRPNGGCPRGRSLAILYWRGVPMVSLIIAAAASGVSTSITNLWKCSWSSSTTIVFSGWWTSQNTRPPSW